MSTLVEWEDSRREGFTETNNVSVQRASSVLILKSAAITSAPGVNAVEQIVAWRARRQ